MKTIRLTIASILASVFCSALAEQIPVDQFVLLYPSAYDITAPYDSADVRCYEGNRVAGDEFCVFDDVDTDIYWLGRNGSKPFVAYRVDDPVVVSFFSIRLPTSKQYNQTGRRPNHFSIYGSNDFDGSNMNAATWEILGSEFNQRATWNPGETRYFSCNPSQNAYSSYKLVIHGATPSENMTDFHQAIRQVEFLTLPASILNVSSDPINELVVSPAYGDLVASGDYQVGHVFTCTAPASGTSQDGQRVYTFKQWELREGTDQENVLIDQGTTPTATFTYRGSKLFLKWIFEEDVSVSPLIIGEGEVSFGSEFFPVDTSISIAATPAEGWKFYRWDVTNGTVLDSSAASTSLIMTAPGSVRALFIPQYASSIDLYVDPINGSDENIGFTPNAPLASVLTAIDLLNFYQEGTIHLSPGTYTTDQDITLSSGISLLGESGRADDVVIHRVRQVGYNDSRCVVLKHPQAFVANITLSNGLVRTTNANGGGLNILEQGGTASNLVITSCFSDGTTSYGVGACLNSNNALLTHSVIRNCQASKTPAGKAGTRGVGVHLYAGRLENCLIENCAQTDATTEVSAGGIALSPTGNDSAIVAHCTIVNCIGGKTGGILAEGSARVYNTVIAGCTGFPPEEGEASIAPWTGLATCFVNCATDGAESINDSCLVGTYSSFFVANHPVQYRPAECLMDQGTSELPNGLPATDFLGNPRLVGSAPDIGFLEAAARATVILMK